MCMCVCMGEIQTKRAGFGFSVQQLERWDEVLPVIAIDLAGFPTPSPPISSRAFRDDDDDLFSSLLLLHSNQLPTLVPFLSFSHIIITALSLFVTIVCKIKD